MVEFLKNIARVYIENEKEHLLDYCFIFPNKRAGVFFGKYLAEVMGQSVVLPQITTINDFVFSLNDKIEASRYEQLFLLYDIYRNLYLKQNSSDDNIHEFDKFQFWGDMLINDFNDADKYMIDTTQLFINVKRFKEINSNYLTEEQINVINKYWGENLTYDDSARFWRHISDDEKSDGISNKFVKIWSKMGEMYDSFNNQLSSQGLTYSGRAYRDAANKLRNINPNELEYHRYIFIGFNVLSTSEIKIFERLKAINCADFYWDYNSPGYIGCFNKASRFLANYIEEFTSKYDTNEPEIKSFPNITIISIPSNIGQVKEAGTVLNHLISTKEISDVNNAIDTAIVLPDESLFIPLINSYPKEFKGNVNITMGYPMRFTPIAAFMKIIVSLHLRARKIRNEFYYFYEDLQNLLAHPLFKSISGQDGNKIDRYIREAKMFNVPCKYLIEQFPDLSTIFKPVAKTTSINDVFDYAIALVDFIRSKVAKISNKNIDKAFVDRYYHSLHNLRDLVKKYGVLMQEHTFFHLIERAIASDTVTFIGEPLHGLQIMGVLETRVLDFKNIIMTSMNERIFPRKHYKGSFIPDALRRSYGMSTIEFQESIYAYYFYRLISRANNVFLLYDYRGKSSRSGDMSRYLFQLKYLFPQENIKFNVSNYGMTLNANQRISITKTNAIMEKINSYRNLESKKYLSASSLKTLVHCPLQFYLQYIEDINIPDEINEHMDSATLGNVVHEVMEKLYIPYIGKEITLDILSKLQSDNINIDRLITVALNRNFNHLHKKLQNADAQTIEQALLTPLSGEAALLFDIIKDIVKLVITRDTDFVPFVFEGAEFVKLGQYKVNDNLSVNFKVKIDRIDKPKNSHYRIVDYKTGSDEISINNLEELFDNSLGKNNAAILQLLIYSVVLNAIDNTGKYTGQSIQPFIYKLRTIYQQKFTPITINKIELIDYKDFLDSAEDSVGFIDLFHRTLQNLFDPTVPFEQTNNDHNCKYCKFKMICGKENDDEN